MVGLCENLTPYLIGDGARSAEGTNTVHENAEGMACSGKRVERPVRLGRAGTVCTFTLIALEGADERISMAFAWDDLAQRSSWHHISGSSSY